MSPNTTPMLPSVRAQKPVEPGPSWASIDVTLTVMIRENALSIILIRPVIDAFLRKLSTTELWQAPPEAQVTAAALSQ